jgi:hypothetical protein
MTITRREQGKINTTLRPRELAVVTKWSVAAERESEMGKCRVRQEAVGKKIMKHRCQCARTFIKRQHAYETWCRAFLATKLESAFIDRLASGSGLSGAFLMVNFERRVTHDMQRG